MNAAIELTALAPVASVETMIEALDTVVQSGHASLTVPPFWVKKLKRDWPLSTSALLATVIGYPYGYQRTEAKQTEAEEALKDGAQEIQVVMNSSAWFSNSNGWPKIEFAKLAKIIHQHEAFFTVIVESSFYDDIQLERALKTAADAGADYIQNATGIFHQSFSIEQALRFKAGIPSATGCKIWAAGALPEEKACLLEHGTERLCLPYKLENQPLS